MRKLFFLVLMTSAVWLWGEALPEWLIPLREALYEQKLNANEIMPIYQTAKTTAQTQRSGAALDTALARCEYFMGRALLFEKRNEEARVHFREGMRLGEKAIAQTPSSEAWLVLTENLSQDCSIGPWNYTVANGLNVEKYSKNALSYNKRNAAAQYLIASRWVYAPAPFNNLRKGIEMMQAIFTDGDMEKDDIFNVNLSIAYAHIEQKKYNDARTWLLKALEIYPTNKYAAELLEKK